MHVLALKEQDLASGQCVTQLLTFFSNFARSFAGIKI